jgi:hypothetical protein
MVNTADEFYWFAEYSSFPRSNRQEQGGKAKLKSISNYIKGKFCVSVCVFVRYRTYLNVVGMGSKLLGVDPAVVLYWSNV